MEDISRELEREIARSKPKPYKQDRKASILIIDDFGKMKSGEYLKTFVKIFLFLSIVCFVASALLYYLYSGLSRDSALIKKRLVSAEKKVAELTSEKEVLMARLVISGKEPGIKKKKVKTDVNKKQDKPAIVKVEEKKPLVSKKEEIKPLPVEPEDQEKTSKIPMPSQDNKAVATKLDVMAPAQKLSEPEPEQQPLPAVEPLKVAKKAVRIEKFTVTKDGSNNDLLVRFDIRNVSTVPGDVSGRIFTVLKPGDGSEDQWLVVPRGALKNGVPSEYKKGQYFSIAHFKPVKFRIKNQAAPDFFKKASIFIFNEQAELIFEELIAITEAK